MNREEFKKLVNSRVPVLDGATGSNLQKKGMPSGVCPEQWILENPDAIIELQREYKDAGSDIVYAPTFTANRLKLSEYGLEDKLVEMNTKLVKLSREAVDRETEPDEATVLVAGDLTMTGQQLVPIGDLTVDELIDVYKEQAEVLVDAGVDLFVVETMMDLGETRAAVIAIRQVCDLPIMATLTFEENGRSMFGAEPKSTVVVLQSLDIDAIGVNCSAGPEAMVKVVEEMREVSAIPIIAKPNAGKPEFVDGETTYRMQPDDFAKGVKKLVEAGASIVGGCCGSTPAHIKAVKEMLSGGTEPVEETSVLECIATGNEAFPLEKDKDNYVFPDDLEILEDDEIEDAIDDDMLQMAVDPVCFKTGDEALLERALRIYPGRAVVSLGDYDDDKKKTLADTAKKYGAIVGNP